MVKILNALGAAGWLLLAIFVRKPTRFDFALAASLLAMTCLGNI